MTNLWDEATRDYDAERDSMLRSAAKITTARWWPFLAEASTERSFGHRLAVVKGDVLAALKEAGVTSARFQEEALEGLAEDFRVLHASRREAAEHVVCPDCNGIGAVPAGGWEDEDDVDNGLKQCPTCKGDGEVPARTAVRRTANRPGSTQRGARALRGSTVTWADGSRTGTIVELAPLDSPPHPVKGRWGDVVTERTRAISKDHPAKEIEACWVSSEGQMVWASVHVPTMKVLYSVETAQQVFSSRKTAAADPKNDKHASDSGWTGMDAIDEGGLFAGQCAQGSPNCNWGWAKDGKGREVYRCSVHGTEQTVSHTRESARMAGSKGWPEMPVQAAGPQAPDVAQSRRTASLTKCAACGGIATAGDRVECLDCGEVSHTAVQHQPVLHQGQSLGGETATRIFDRMTQDERFLGWGYLGDRGRFLRDPDPESVITLDLIVEADEAILEVARDMGWTYDDLFAWANSKDGRWFADMAFGSGDLRGAMRYLRKQHTATRKVARFEDIVVGDRVTLKARGVPDLADMKMRNGNPAKATDWIVEALVRLDDYMADSGLSHGEDAYEMVENWLRDRGHDFPFLDRPAYVNDTMLARVKDDSGNEMVFPVSGLVRASEPPMDGQKVLPGMSRVR